jgi:acetolactate synthase-1/2/3 large subunit
MLVLGGRHLIRQELKGGLQEMDHTRLFRSITKWAATAWQVDRLAEYVATAARHAFSGRGGPVFLDVPLDVQFDTVDDATVTLQDGHRATTPQGVDGAALDRIVDALTGSERVVIFAGALAPGPNRLTELSQALQAPTFVNSRARGSLPFGHPLLGNHVRTRAMAEAEVVLALGVDWDFRTGYGEKVSPNGVVIQVDADSGKVGWNRRADLGLVADPNTVISQLADHLAGKERETPTWTKLIMEAEAEKIEAANAEAADDSSPVMPQRFARDVAGFFGPDSIVSVDGGDIVSTTARWLQVSTPGHVLDPGPFGTLGTGAPYAIAAKVAFPEKRVGIVFGDGGFGFNGIEYDTMVRHRLAIIGVIGNDGAWGNIKTFHRMAYPDRVVAADLGVRPYHEMVRGLGGHGELVEDPAEILPALGRAEASGLPSLVNVHLAETMRMSSNYAQ